LPRKKKKTQRKIQPTRHELKTILTRILGRIKETTPEESEAPLRSCSSERSALKKSKKKATHSLHWTREEKGCEKTEPKKGERTAQKAGEQPSPKKYKRQGFWRETPLCNQSNVVTVGSKRATPTKKRGTAAAGTFSSECRREAQKMQNQHQKGMRRVTRTLRGKGLTSEWGGPRKRGGKVEGTSANTKKTRFKGCLVDGSREKTGVECKGKRYNEKHRACSWAKPKFPDATLRNKNRGANKTRRNRILTRFKKNMRHQGMNPTKKDRARGEQPSSSADGQFKQKSKKT